jgi:ribosomal protein S18 acetylase RimI-like enzyme
MKIEKLDNIEVELDYMLNIFNEARKSAEGLSDKTYSLLEFSAQIEGEEILVAKFNGEMAGFVSVWRQDNFIHHLYVSPKFQRKKIGEALLQECQNRYSLPLSLKCVEANKKACSFYERNGWIVKSKEIDNEGSYILYRLQDI